ncbi:MAG: MarR family transcriptional regulator [Erysipelotrichaceae bacterium]|jgi:DNA-binding MarR family transcriptional regulator|nr:MarR family transcriptional regulator [Erysipelotrichaceae bacterium]
MTSIVRSITTLSRIIRYRRETSLSLQEFPAFWHNYLLTIHRHPGISQDQIAKRLLVDKSNAARQLGKLAQLGYIIRTTDESDARRYNVTLSERGEALIPKLRDIHDQVEKVLLSALTLDEQEAFLPLLEKVLDKAKTELAQREEE